MLTVYGITPVNYVHTASQSSLHGEPSVSITMLCLFSQCELVGCCKLFTRKISRE